MSEFKVKLEWNLDSRISPIRIIPVPINGFLGEALKSLHLQLRSFWGKLNLSILKKPSLLPFPAATY